MKAMKEPVPLLWIRPSQRSVVNQLSTTLGHIPARCCILMDNILTVTINGSCTEEVVLSITLFVQIRRLMQV